MDSKASQEVIPDVASPRDTRRGATERRPLTTEHPVRPPVDRPSAPDAGREERGTPAPEDVLEAEPGLDEPAGEEGVDTISPGGPGGVHVGHLPDPGGSEDAPTDGPPVHIGKIPPDELRDTTP